MDVTGRRLINYLAGLTLSGGDHDGERFRVLGWERRFVLGTFAVSGPAALSVAEARTISDPAGNAKLAKGNEGGRRHRARDDAAAAAILAVSAGLRRARRTTGRRVYHGVVG